MAYDEVLAQRVHDLLDGVEGVTSRKMFGGMGFMVHGHLAVAAGSSGSVMVRVLVAPQALECDEALQLWVDRGVDYVGSLPPKLP